MAAISPFEMTVSGKAEIPHPAERALINVTVSSEGTNKPSVSDEVITTAKHIETLLRELSPANDSPEAKAAAPLAHWDKTSLSSTSYVPTQYNSEKNIHESLPRRYRASVTFDIRFKEFKALGSFGTKISSMSHVEVGNIDWILTDITEKAYRSRLRREAAQDALEKVQDYCEVLGCQNIRATELQEITISSHAIGRTSKMKTSNVAMQSMQMAPSNQMARQMCKSAFFLAFEQFADHSKARNENMGDDEIARQSAELEFRPQEVRMTHEITIKFQAE